MKKLIVFPFLFLLPISVFAQDKSLFTQSFLEAEYFGTYIEFIGNGVLLATNQLLYAEVRGYLNKEQTFQLPTFSLLSNRTNLFRIVDIENKEQKTKKPPLSSDRISREILAGVLGGVAGAFVGTRVGEILDSRIDGRALVGHMGYFLGNSISIYLVGNIGNETGSFLATLLGSVLGNILGLPFAYMHGTTENKNMRSIYTVLMIIGFDVGPSIGATIGFNMTRRYKAPPAPETALLNFSDGEMSFVIPTIYFKSNFFDVMTLVQYVDLVKMRF